MPGAAGIRAGSAYVELTVNDSKLVRGLAAAGKKLRAFGTALRSLGTRVMAVGAGIIAPLLMSMKAFATMGDALDKMSKRTGMSVESLSELGFAAEQSGSSLEDVEKGVKAMERVIGAAASGAAAAADALATLGLSAEQLLALAPEDRFAAIAQRLNALSDPALRAAAAMKVFGRSGTALLPMLEDLPQLRAEARRLGVVMSAEDAKAAAVFHEALVKLWAALRSLAVTVGSALAPLLTEWAGKIVELVASFRDWLSQNRGLVVSILKIGLVVVAAGAALYVLGSACAAVGFAITGISALLSFFGTVAAAVFGALLSETGLVIVAVAAVAGVILWATGTGGKALDWLGARFADLKGFAVESFQGIKDALAAGDVILAAKIFWLSLQVAWRAGINQLKSWWLGFKDAFLQTTSDIFYGAVVLVARAWYGLKTIWATTVNYWADALSRFSSFFLRTWNDLLGWLAKQWTKVSGLFDSSIDVEAVNKTIDEQTRQENLEVSRKVIDERIAGEKELANIEEERRLVLVGIADEADQETKSRQAEYAVELKASEDELARAKEEWRAALVAAKEKRAAYEAGRPEAGAAPELQLPDLGAVMERAELALGVTGTFSAEAANRMGLGDTTAERTAKATEETARQTKKIAQALEQGQIAFE